MALHHPEAIRTPDSGETSLRKLERAIDWVKEKRVALASTGFAGGVLLTIDPSRLETFIPAVAAGALGAVTGFGIAEAHRKEKRNTAASNR